MSRYVGVDLHKTNFVVCWYTDEQKYQLETYSMEKESIEKFKSKLSKQDEVAVESTGNAFYFAREIEEVVKKVRVIDPYQFQVISKSVKKTDKNDARLIAQYLSKGLLPEIRVRSKKESQIGSLISTRDQLVKSRSSLKNKIHSILNQNGIVTKKESLNSNKALEDILKCKLDEMVLLELEILIRTIKTLNENIKKIDKAIEEAGKNLKGYETLSSITGIGNLTATILLNTIGKIEDFENEKKLTAYFGMAPRVYQSNETCHYGRITKRGNPIARTSLVQATWVAIRYSPYLRNFYKKLQKRKGSAKAIIATARKFLTIIFQALKNNWIFQDFNKFVLVA